ncbi:MAG TPA: glycerol-3-phosphate dehydrogenase/oxidase, partial [Marmoricola sp.]|nr:glycerol-3-phosphate dehydrogenase/oxidase [Marmoricola sp.]
MTDTTLLNPAPSSEARIRVGATDLPAEVDVLVIGLGVTGAGVALDAASRGLKVLAVDARDIAWGTSRFSSKLVHGGLRYLANGQIGVAHESAVERGILMQITAPHLVHTLPMLIPLTPSVPKANGVLARVGVGAGDLLRAGARTPASLLPRSRHVRVAKTLEMVPVAKRDGLRGGVLSFDGQLEDDARLVMNMARTAVAFGADVRTHLRVKDATGTSAILIDDAGVEHRVTARAVISAAGVWAGDLDADIKLRPSRGTHIVVRADRFPGVRCAVMAPVPSHANRFVFALPQQDGTFYIGLTDEEVDTIPEVPTAPEGDIDFLLEIINSALQQPLSKDDVVGAYAGLRPLLDTGSGAGGAAADISRKHAVLVSKTGLITIVGGKLTTYRQMAEDAVDKAVETAHLHADACQTKHLPLLGA